MELYLDSANVDDWQKLMPLGFLKGITTNPLLVARAGLEYPDIDWFEMAKRASDLGAIELHAQVYGSSDNYLTWSEKLLEAGSSANIRTVAKVPLIPDAIAIVPQLKSLGCPILMTACYSAQQMILSSALGADYIAPYFGRMLERKLPAYEAMAQMLAVEASPNNRTRILIASLRNIEQMIRLSEMGCTCFTLSPALVSDLVNDDESSRAVQEFEMAMPFAGLSQ
ncbi:MAG: transaldolase family protein [Paracoccaceae bacterium]|nr:transaldolase family protein [Paracoccaceae bacterium]